MKVTMTNKDRNLLIGILCAAIFVFFYQLVLVPGFQNIQDTQAQLEEAEGEKNMMLMQLEMTANIEETISNNIDKRIEAAWPYLDQILKTRDIDDMLTDMVLQCGLFPEGLALTEPVNGMIGYYPLAKPSEEELAGQKEDTIKFVNLSDASIRAIGTKDQCDALLDAIMANTALHLNTFKLEYGETEQDVTVECNLTVIMCAEGADEQ